MVMQRSTPQRAAVAELLAGSPDFRSAQEVHEELRAAGQSIGLATVYRTLQAMVESGTADTLRRSDGEAIYRLCQRPGHHHHLVCRSCGTAIEIDGPDAETWARSVAASYGFTQVEHTFEIFGLCPACTARQAEHG